MSKKDNKVIMTGAAVAILAWWFWPSDTQGQQQPANNKYLPPGQDGQAYNVTNEGGQAGWIRSMYNNAKAESDASGGAEPVPFILAQSALETFYGTSPVYKNANNAFGIRADSSWQGDTYNGYRKYNSVADSFADHLAYLKTNSNYSPLWNPLNNGDPYAWASAINGTGYSENPNYGQTIVQMIPLVMAALKGYAPGY